LGERKEKKRKKERKRGLYFRRKRTYKAVEAQFRNVQRYPTGLNVISVYPARTALSTMRMKLRSIIFVTRDPNITYSP